jgi:tetratricopeptide (TPR) repeat protein
VRIGEQANHAYSLHFACLGLGTLHLRQGDWERAIPLLERARDLCRVADAPAMLALAAGFLGSAYVGAGRVDEALALLEHAQEHAASIGLPGSTLGFGVRLAARAEAFLRAGQVDRARETGRQVVDHFGRLGARGYQAWALRLLAAATARARDFTEAEALYEQALVLASTLGMRPLAAQCLLELGELHCEVGRSDAARSALARAVEMFGTMEAPLWSARAEQVAATLS